MLVDGQGYHYFVNKKRETRYNHYLTFSIQYQYDTVKSTISKIENLLSLDFPLQKRKKHKDVLFLGWKHFLCLTSLKPI